MTLQRTLANSVSTGGPLETAGVLAVPAGSANGIAILNANKQIVTDPDLTFDGITLTTVGNVVVSANTSTDALRITQTGSGNALLVEDSANPDSTPFVIDTNGRAIVGSTAALIYSSSLSVIPNLQVNAAGPITSGVSRFSANNAANSYWFLKSRGATVGAFDIVASGDSLGTIGWLGADGTDGIQAATISAAVDGTPATNDMPGRLVFSTTADGAASPTERMRIDNAGNVGIGVTPTGGRKFVVAGTYPTSAANSVVIASEGTIPSGTTTTAQIFRSNPSTAAAAFTLSNLVHFYAAQGTIGSTSAISSQYGFIAEASLTGATNNYGFYGNIASGTGRYNLFMAGTADNYFAGNVGIGSTSLTGVSLRISKNVTGSAFSYPMYIDGTIQSDVTSAYASIQSNPATVAAAFTLTNLRHFYANQGSIGAGSAVTNQYGFHAENSLTSATNNYGFYGNIASGTGRWNFYAAGTAANYFAGDSTFNSNLLVNGGIGLGSTVYAGFSFVIGKNITGALNSYGIYNGGTVQSDVTASVEYFSTNAQTAAAAFSLSSLKHYNASQSALGAGSAIGVQYGFAVSSTLTSASTNYGFHGAIASGGGRWNLYMAGTAANFLAGDLILNGKVGIGAAASPSYGTSGQVLTSQGSGASPTWSTPTGTTTGKAIAMAIVFGG